MLAIKHTGEYPYETTCVFGLGLHERVSAATHIATWSDRRAGIDIGVATDVNALATWRRTVGRIARARGLPSSADIGGLGRWAAVQAAGVDGVQRVVHHVRIGVL
jgi:hypothetical protein